MVKDLQIMRKFEHDWNKSDFNFTKLKQTEAEVVYSVGFYYPVSVYTNKSKVSINARNIVE